jgi:hypothetical protein
VACELYKGTYHAFDVLVPKAETSRKATEFFINRFKAAV